MILLDTHLRFCRVIHIKPELNVWPAMGMSKEDADLGFLNLYPSGMEGYHIQIAGRKLDMKSTVATFAVRRTVPTLPKGSKAHTYLTRSYLMNG